MRNWTLGFQVVIFFLGFQRRLVWTFSPYPEEPHTYTIWASDVIRVFLSSTIAKKLSFVTENISCRKHHSFLPIVQTSEAPNSKILNSRGGMTYIAVFSSSTSNRKQSQFFKIMHGIKGESPGRSFRWGVVRKILYSRFLTSLDAYYWRILI